jgi:heme oxygenase
MMMEVEKDSLKRRVESLEIDSQELSKTRRLYDDVRFKHVSAEATVEASIKVQEMQRSQLQRLETELREVRAAAQLRDLELTRKTATLELQLQARGIALT